MRQVYDDVIKAVQNIAPGPEMTATFEGSDQTGAVKVTMSPTGLLQDLSVSRSWSRELAPDSLGSAVLEAMQDATVRRLQAWGQTVSGAPTPSPKKDSVVGRTPSAQPKPRFNAKPLPSPKPPGDPTSVEAQDTLSELLGLLDGVSGALADLENTIAQRMSAEVVGRGPGGRAVVTLRGAEAIKVTLDRTWLRSAEPDVISQQVRQAFQAAYEQRGQVTMKDMVDGGPIAKVFDLTKDPQELLRKLGLTQ